MKIYRVDLLTTQPSTKLDKEYLYRIARQLLDENEELKRAARNFIDVADQPSEQRFEELKYELFKLL